MTVQADHLVTFAVVAQEGSVTAAAERLHRSQPAVSAQLKGLSEAVGEPLYSRHRHGVTLTPAGQALLPYAQALSRALLGARRIGSEFKGLERGSLRVAASMTVAVYLLPGILARFRRLQPGLELRLLTRNTREALALLAEGDADLALVEGPVETLPVDSVKRVIFEDEIVLVAPPGHPLSAKKTVRPAELRGLAIVQREPGSGTREVVERALSPWGLKLGTALEATGIEAVKEAVLQGLGPGFLSRLAVTREVEAGLLSAVPVEAEGFKRPMTLLHPRLELCSQAARAFLAFLA